MRSREKDRGKGSEPRLPGGRERSDRGWLRAQWKLLRLCNAKVLGLGQQAQQWGVGGGGGEGAGRAGDKEASILPLVTMEAQAQVT